MTSKTDFPNDLLAPRCSDHRQSQRGAQILFSLLYFSLLFFLSVVGWAVALFL